MATQIVKLKKLVKENRSKLYAIIPLTKSELEESTKNKSLPKTVLDRCLEENIIANTETKMIVLHKGLLKNFTSYADLVYEFPRTNRQLRDKKKEQYRDYTVPLDQQKNMMHLVTLCSCLTSSWRTALRACNSEYGIIVEINRYE